MRDPIEWSETPGGPRERAALHTHSPCGALIDQSSRGQAMTPTTGASELSGRNKSFATPLAIPQNWVQFGRQASSDLQKFPGRSVRAGAQWGQGEVDGSQVGLGSREPAPLPYVNFSGLCRSPNANQRNARDSRLPGGTFSLINELKKDGALS